MSKIETILLDADGVLIQPEMWSQYLEEKYGIAQKTTVEFYRGPFVDCLLGKQDMYDILPSYLTKWGWKKSTEDFVTEWFDYEDRVDSEIITYIQRLRKFGIACYVATNQEKHRANYMLDRMGFRDQFDGLFASAHLGSRKPELAFFESIMSKLGIADKKSVLFVDDTLENVEGAREFGINTEFYSEFADFKQTLEDKYQITAT